jgi:hypothetical protein
MANTAAASTIFFIKTPNAFPKVSRIRPSKNGATTDRD